MLAGIFGEGYKRKQENIHTLKNHKGCGTQIRFTAYCVGHPPAFLGALRPYRGAPGKNLSLGADGRMARGEQTPEALTFSSSSGLHAK